MPFTALIGVPPESVPPLEAGSSATPIVPVNPCTTCSEASSAATCTGGVIAALAWVVCGCRVNPRCVGGGGGGGGPGVMSNATLVSSGAALPNAPVRAERDSDRAGEVRGLVPERVVRGDLNGRLDRAVLHRGARRYRKREHGGGRGHDAER